MKSRIFLTILTAMMGLSTGNAVSQTVVKTNDQINKKEQNIKVWVKEDPKTVEKEMTIMADSAFHGLGNDLKNKKVTVTVISSDNGAGNSSSYSYSIGDTIPKGGEPKVARSVNGKNMIYMVRSDGENSDLTTQPHRVKGYRVSGHPSRDPFAFDPADTSIVSYQKKDVGKGLEKITIVRKKATSSK